MDMMYKDPALVLIRKHVISSYRMSPLKITQRADYKESMCKHTTAALYTKYLYIKELLFGLKRVV